MTIVYHEPGLLTTGDLGRKQNVTLGPHTGPAPACGGLSNDAICPVMDNAVCNMWLPAAPPHDTR